jgi:hypothetical protein
MKMISFFRMSDCYHHSSCFTTETSVEVMSCKRIVDSIGLVECRDGDRKKLGWVYDRVDAEWEVEVPLGVRSLKV